MLSVPDWNIPILGFKSGDPAAEADTQDWTLGIVAEEGSKLGGGEIIDISRDSEYYVSDNFDDFLFDCYANVVNGGSGYVSSEQYVQLDLQEKLSSLTRPGIALSIQLSGVASPADTAYTVSYSWLEARIRAPGASSMVADFQMYCRKYLIGGIWHSVCQHGGPFIKDVSAFKTQEMQIRLRIRRRNTTSDYNSTGFLRSKAMLFEIVG